MSLVPEYETDSEENISSDSDSSIIEDPVKPEKKHEKLLGADVLLTGIRTETVLQNPYRLKESAKIKQLEQHVKMVDTKNTKRLNGKRICFSFQKGKCRFGAKCLYAHDELNNLSEKSENIHIKSARRPNFKKSVNRKPATKNGPAHILRKRPEELHRNEF